MTNKFKLWNVQKRKFQMTVVSNSFYLWEHRSPIQMWCGIFIFITVRWQLFSQEAELIRQHFLLTFSENKWKYEHLINHSNEDGQIRKWHGQEKCISGEGAGLEPCNGFIFQGIYQFETSTDPWCLSILILLFLSKTQSNLQLLNSTYATQSINTTTTQKPWASHNPHHSPDLVITKSR